MKEKCFKLAKGTRRRYPAQTITDADFADDIALLANSPAQAESPLRSLERVAGGINQTGGISTLKGGPLKQVEVRLPSHQSRMTSTPD